MKSRRIRVENLSVRLRGATASQAQQRGGAIAQQIAHALAGQAAGLGQNQKIAKLSVRVPARGGAAIAAQIRREWSGE